jgi:carbon monoxide dehydrogenase subunit G
MEMTSTRIVPAPVETVWAALNDPALLTGCIPGCDEIVPDGENAFRISIAARVGPVSAKFAGRMQLADLDPPRAYTLAFDGQGGAAGFAKGQARVSLAPVENGAATELSYAVSAQVGGKIAQIGSRLVDGAAQKLADDFFGKFSEAVAVQVGAAPAPVPEPAPAPRRRWVRYVAIAILIGIIAYLFSRAAR